MKYRVAVASTDSVVVNQHFGRADRFLIAEIDTEKETYHFLDPRNVNPCCNGFDHEEPSFDAVLKVLEDVQVIFVSKIGAGAAGYLESKGMITYEAPYMINDVFDKLIETRTWEEDQWQSHLKN